MCVFRSRDKANHNFEMKIVFFLLKIHLLFLICNSVLSLKESGQKLTIKHVTK